MNFQIPPSPEISPYMEKKYSGYTVISLNGRILGIGKNVLLAVKNAKRKMKDIEDKEFLISKIDGNKIHLCIGIHI